MTALQWICFASLTLVWGSSFMWIKIAVREVGPLTVVAVRLAFALAVLVGVLVVRRSGVPRGWRRWGVLLMQGLMSTAIPWVLITWAEKHIDSAVATVLNATVPMFTIAAAHVFLRDDRMTIGRGVGLVVGFCGVLVLVSRQMGSEPFGDTGRWVLLGQGAMLLSSFFYGVSNVYARVKLRGVSPLVQAFYTMLLADAVMWAIVPAVESPVVLPHSGLVWLAIAWLGVLGAGLSYVLFYYLLHAIGPTRVAVVTYTIPLVGVTLGVLFLGERLDWALVVGGVLVVSGVWGVNRRARPPGAQVAVERRDAR